MSYRIAVASTDGKVINIHFGRADKFLVFEVEDSTYHFIELRSSNPPCFDFQHEQSVMDAAVDILSDCEAVFALRIGPGAARALIMRGIRPFEAGCFIEDAIKKYIELKSDSESQ